VYDEMEEGYGSRGRRTYIRKPKFCQFCVDKINELDHKQTDVLRRYVSDRGKIRPRRQTGACARHQRMLATAIKRSRHLALLPFVTDRVR